jgi:hypothetical protein
MYFNYDNYMTIVIFIKIFSPLSRGSLYYVSSDYFFSSTLLFKISLAQEFGRKPNLEKFSIYSNKFFHNFHLFRIQYYLSLAWGNCVFSLLGELSYDWLILEMEYIVFDSIRTLELMRFWKAVWKRKNNQKKHNKDFP